MQSGILFQNEINLNESHFTMFILLANIVNVKTNQCMLIVLVIFNQNITICFHLAVDSGLTDSFNKICLATPTQATQ